MMVQFNQRHTLVCIISFVVSFMAACNNRPVLSELINTRVNFVFKGTYESNSPHDWKDIHLNDSLASQPTGLDAPVDINDFKFYFDLAEIGISELSKKASDTEEEDWSFFFRTRTLLCPENEASDGTVFKTCRETQGVQKLNDFFEEGLLLESSDVAAGVYRSLAIYPRRMITSPGALYNASNEIVNDPTPPTFDSKRVEGTNIAGTYEYALGDDTDDQDTRIFPIINTGLNLNIPSGKGSYTLEVRMFLKNLMMKHVIHNPNNLTIPRIVFIGPSDWLANHAFDDTTRPNDQNPRNFSRLGGNILITARAYSPSSSTDLEITSTGPCPGTGLSYLAVLPAGVSFERTRLPLAATKLLNGASETIENLPLGEYDLYITHDRLRQESSGEVLGEDGFPDFSLLCMSGLSLENTETRNVDISSCMCPP